MPTDEEDLHGTLQRSPEGAQRSRGAGFGARAVRHEERAHRVAYSALKHSYGKVGSAGRRR